MLCLHSGVLRRLAHSDPLDAKLRNEGSAPAHREDEGIVPPEPRNSSERREDLEADAPQPPSDRSPRVKMVRNPPAAVHACQQDDALDLIRPVLAFHPLAVGLEYLLERSLLRLSASDDIQLAR